MTASDNPLERWHRLATELKTYRDALHETWGDLDDVAMANYLAGRPTDAERADVERAIREKPAVREMIEVVSEVFEPAWIALAKTSAPELDVKRLAKSLQMWIDDAGGVVVDGIQRFLKTPQLADIALGEDEVLDGGDAVATNERIWVIPTEECLISLRAKPGTTFNKWFLSFELGGVVDPVLIGKARFALTNMADSALPMIEGGVSRHSGSFHEVATGSWELRLEIGDAVRIIPLQLGIPLNTSQEDS